jgi:hypothetical protein
VTFQPGDANGETFIGQSGASNTLDLTGESSSLPFTDSMNADTLTAEGSAASEPSSGSPFTVSFANVTQVDGSPGGTDFQPGTATAPNSVDFVGSTGSAATNVLDSYFTIVRSLGAQPRYLKAEVTAQASDALAAESAERRRRVVLVVDEAREIDRGFAGPSGAC